MLTTGPQVDGDIRVLPSLKPRPRPAHYGAAWSFVLFGADLAGAAAGVFGAQLITNQNVATLVDVPGAFETVAFAALIWILLFERIGMYRRSFSSRARDDVYASLAASAISMLPALVIFLGDPLLWPLRHTLVLAVFLSAAGVSFTRYCAQVLRLRLHARRPRRIAVVGAPERVKAVPGDLSLSATDQVVRIPIEAFDDDINMALTGDVADISWLKIVRERNCDELIVTEALPSAMMPHFLRYTESLGIKVAFAPMRIRPYACDFSIGRDGGLALLYPRSLTICTPGAEWARRIFDTALTLPAVVLLAPLFGLIALAVYLDSGAPVLYRQTRVGRRGKTFEILKFRTMKVDAESDSGPVWAHPGESRTTRVGRFLRRTSLDELPQLINVLRGEMSIVGPRPERPYYVEQFRKMLPRYDERHLVRPGITGWSHINMKRNVDTSAIGERLSYDLFYLEHWSVFMDILIVCKTAAEFLFHSAA
jgi:exopolysaccharide biosynthesis polyprenyl glycosylphosphotransferase